MYRRNFLKTISIESTVLSLPLDSEADNFDHKSGKVLRFGICADVHKDIMHDADLRMQAFIDEVTEKEVDFIIQLGDFCRPYDYNRGFMDIWNSFKGKKFHVIGNHDMDGGFTREQVVDYWESKGRYYSFDLKGVHCVVLDGNDEDTSSDRPRGYARYLGEEQLKWLENDLDGTDLPTLVFSHQGLDNNLGGIFNATKSRFVLERANKIAGFQKVIAAFSGHHHQDYHNVINGINYIQINSMSYQWLGNQYKHIRYSKKIDKKYPWIKYTVPYKDPLWAIVELIPRKMINVTGKKSEFVGPSHLDLGMDKLEFEYDIVAIVSDRTIKLF